MTFGVPRTEVLAAARTFCDRAVITEVRSPKFRNPNSAFLNHKSYLIRYPDI